MMEYSGALGGEGGGSQRLCVRRVDERVERREERGSMWDLMSEAEGSRVRRSMPEFMSWVYVILEFAGVLGRVGLTGSAGKRREGAMPFSTSSLMLRMVCWRVRMLSVRCWFILVSGDDAEARLGSEVA
jgi:hypothetical protein